MELLENAGGVAEVGPLPRHLDFDDREPNDELLEAFDEVERMKRDPSLRQGYTSAKELFAGIRANVDY
jgi:hypothetical protein